MASRHKSDDHMITVAVRNGVVVLDHSSFEVTFTPEDARKLAASLLLAVAATRETSTALVKVGQ